MAMAAASHQSMPTSWRSGMHRSPRWLVPRAVYIHIPFCSTVCAYCDFAVIANASDRIPAYIDALSGEIAQDTALADAPGQRVPLETIYFGGGTPSLLHPAQMAHLLRTIGTTFGPVPPDAEVTLEANPGTFDLSTARAWVAAGVTRVSLGMQSLDDATLQLLGRTHRAETALEAVAILREAGIRSVNLDLIYGLPNQTLADWVDGLPRVIATKPDHVSLYALAIEEGTPLARQVGAGRWGVPDDDAVADLYEAALPILGQAGLRHYEVSNWAQPGHESRHNLTYWRNEAYFGYGLGAHRYVDGRRSWNTRHLDTYLQKRGQASIGMQARDRLAIRHGVTSDQYTTVEEGHERLGLDDVLGETAILALRIRDEGIDRDRFLTRFGVDPLIRWRDIFLEAESHGLLRCTDDRACLTDAGLLVSNEIGRRILAANRSQRSVTSSRS